MNMKLPRIFKHTALLPMLILVSLAASAQDDEPECELGRAWYESGPVQIQFGLKNPNSFEVALPKVKFFGRIDAISGYGYTVYYLYESQDATDSFSGGTVYGLGQDEKGELVEGGGWGTLPAPAGLLLSDIGRNIYYYLRDKGRKSEFELMSDLFIYQGCLD